MLSSVLKRKWAVLVKGSIMRTFVRLHEMLASNKELARRSAFEQKYDKQFKAEFGAIRVLMGSPEAETRKRAIRFLADRDEYHV